MQRAKEELGAFDATDAALAGLRRSMGAVAASIDTMRGDGKKVYGALVRDAAALDEAVDSGQQVLLEPTAPPQSPSLPSPSSTPEPPRHSPLQSKPSHSPVQSTPPPAQQQPSSSAPSTASTGVEGYATVIAARSQLQQCKAALAAADDALAAHRARGGNFHWSEAEQSTLEAGVTAVLRTGPHECLPATPTPALSRWLADRLPERPPSTITARYRWFAGLRALQSERRDAVALWRDAKTQLSAARVQAAAEEAAAADAEAATSAAAAAASAMAAEAAAAAKRRAVAEWRARKHADAAAARQAKAEAAAAARKAAAASRQASQRHRAEAREAARARDAARARAARVLAQAAPEGRGGSAPPPRGPSTAQRARRAVEAGKARARALGLGGGLAVQGTAVGVAPPPPALGEIRIPAVPGGKVQRRVVPANPARLRAGTAASTARQAAASGSEGGGPTGRGGGPTTAWAGTGARRVTAVPKWRSGL